MENKTKIKEIWMKRPKEVIIAEIHKLKSDYTSSKISWKYSTKERDIKRFAQYKAFYFAAIILRKRLLRKKKISDKDLNQILEILNKKYPSLSPSFIKNSVNINFYALKSLEDNWSREAQK